MKNFLLILALCASAFGQVSTTNIDDFTAGGTCTLATWCNAHDIGTSGTSTGATSLVSSPSKDGQAREFDFTWTGHGGHRFSANFGPGNLDGTSIIQGISFWYQISTLANIEIPIEIDYNQVLNNGQTVIFGHQCNLTTGKWQVTSNLSGAAHWNDSSATCGDLTPGSWHQFTILGDQRDATGNITYGSITVDGVTQAFGLSALAANFSLSWGLNQQVLNFQIDGNGTAGSATAYLDSVTVISSGFIDDFSTGTLDTKRWKCLNESAPGGIVGKNVGTFTCDPSHFSLAQGMLEFILTQSGTAPTTSIGGGIQSNNRYAYGEYHVDMRSASTSATPGGMGTCVSGQDASPFLFFTNSQGEIDWPEITGDACSHLQYTTWKTTGSKQADFVTLSNPEAGFHNYGLIHTPASDFFYVDGTLVATHSTVVPNIPMWFMASLWGTNNPSFGGVSTPGTTRYMYIDMASFVPAGTAPPPPTGLGAIIH